MKGLRIFISSVQKSDGFATVTGRKAEEVTGEGKIAARVPARVAARLAASVAASVAASIA